MRKVMVRAWQIAKEAVKMFGGNVKEFFAQALTIAWKEVKSVVELQGSEKQVKWALSIRKNMIMQLNLISVNGTNTEICRLAKMVGVEAPMLSNTFADQSIDLTSVRQQIKLAVSRAKMNFATLEKATSYINNRDFRVYQIVKMFK